MLFRSPIWISLLIAAFAIIFAGYVVLWSVSVSLWAVEVSLMACSLGSIASAVIFVFQGNGFVGIAMVGAAMFCAGLSIFLFFGCKAVTKGILFLTKKIIFGVKSLILGKEDIK